MGTLSETIPSKNYVQKAPNQVPFNNAFSFFKTNIKRNRACRRIRIQIMFLCKTIIL